MNSIDIVLITASIMILLEGLFLAIFSNSALKTFKQIFKNRKNLVKAGLIEIILALLILFLIAL